MLLNSCTYAMQCDVCCHLKPIGLQVEEVDEQARQRAAERHRVQHRSGFRLCAGTAQD